MRIAIGTCKCLWTAQGTPGSWQVIQPLKQMAEFASVGWIPQGEGRPPRLVTGARSWFWEPTVLTSDDDGITWSEPHAKAGNEI
jgi:hypothetical protein